MQINTSSCTTCKPRSSRRNVKQLEYLIKRSHKICGRSNFYARRRHSEHTRTRAFRQRMHACIHQNVLSLLVRFVFIKLDLLSIRPISTRRKLTNGARIGLTGSLHVDLYRARIASVPFRCLKFPNFRSFFFPIWQPATLALEELAPHCFLLNQPYTHPFPLALYFFSLLNAPLFSLSLSL